MASSNDSNIKYPYYVIKNTYKAPIYDESQDKVLLEPKKHLSYLHSQHEVSSSQLNMFILKSWFLLDKMHSHDLLLIVSIIVKPSSLIWQGLNV